LTQRGRIHEVRSHAKGKGSSGNEFSGIRRIHSTSWNQAGIRKRGLERPKILRTTDIPAGKNLHQARAVLLSVHQLGWRQGSGNR
jgi:hypothetical protein